MHRDAISPKIVRSAGDLLSDGRKKIRDLHQRGLEGDQVSGRLASLVDDIAGRLFNAALDTLDDADADEVRTNTACVALGSYGRRQLAPFSDVDLMIVQGKNVVQGLEDVAKRFLKAMFDVGLQLAQSVRTPTEIVQLARTDVVICTSMIDGRLIVGRQTVFDDYRERFAKMVARRSKTLAREFHASRSAERRQYGESVYLLEPNVKRSHGALRDLDLLQWLSYVDHGETDPDRLRLAGALSKFEHHRLVSARKWLLRLRNELHFYAEKANESLTRAQQLRIAEVLGYSDRPGLLSVEQFMRDYFRHTGFVWQLVRRREATLNLEATALTRVLDPVLGKNIEGDYRVGVKKISATPSGLAKLRENLTEVLRLVYLAAKQGKQFDQPTWSALLLAAPDFDEDIDEATIGMFFDILRNPSAVGSALRTLHELGYLEKVVPAVRHARCLLQFNQYHKYTVDEHSLRAVAAAAEFVDADSAIGEAYRAVDRKDLLHLALLLHDLGKGFEEDHSEAGLRIAAETATRLHIADEDAECVKFLVHRHLAMSHLTFRSDTSDCNIVQQFAAEVGSAERLRMLFVLTCADLAAVGPGVLTSWKVEVLRNLFHRAMAALPGIMEPGDTAESNENALKEQVLDHLSAAQRAEAWFLRQVEALDDALFATHSAERIAEMLVQFYGLEPRGAVAWGRNNSESKTVEFTAGVESGPGRGVFSSMAGVLSGERMQILSADTTVLPDELLQLRFVVHDKDHPDGTPDDRLAQLSEALVHSVDCLDPPKFRRVWGQDSEETAVRLSKAPSQVRISNSASSKLTTIEVITFDRVGLLFDLSRKLHELDLIIRLAKIGGRLDQVVDVFFVTARDGKKIEAEDQIERIRSELFIVVDKPTIVV